MKKSYQLKNKYNNIVLLNFASPRAAFRYLKNKYQITFCNKTFIDFIDEWKLVEVNVFNNHTITFTKR
jgi:hypothetical protein